MTFQNSSQAISFVKDSKTINANLSFDLSKYCAKLIRDKNSENEGREIVIRVLDAWEKIDKNL